jgi:uncharacterized protein
LRSSGVDTGGPPALSVADRQNFANRLDTWLAKQDRAPEGAGEVPGQS